MPSCQPLKAFNRLFLCLLSSLLLYLFVYLYKIFWVLHQLSVKNESMSFFFLDALGDAGEYLKKKYIEKGMRKVFKELKAQGKRIILFSFACSQTSVTRPLGGLWKLWCLMLKLCSKQSLPSPV